MAHVYPEVVFKILKSQAWALTKNDRLLAMVSVHAVLPEVHPARVSAFYFSGVLGRAWEVEHSSYLVTNISIF